MHINDKSYTSLNLGLPNPFLSIHRKGDDTGAFLLYPTNFSNICLWLKHLFVIKNTLANTLLKQEEEIWQDWMLAAGWDKRATGGNLLW